MTTEQQLAKLRDQYRKARAENDELRMDLIKRMAERIKKPPEKYFYEEVKRSLF